MQSKTYINRILVGCAMTALVSASALAGSHSWDINELFSNADGSVQFIELHEASGADGEIGLAGKKIVSDSTGNEFTFTQNLVGPTGDKHLLLATADFAALPGAPTPDYIIPAGFFDITGDTISYHIYDTFVFGKGEVPVDCTNSLNRDHSTGANSPTNYDSGTGSVDACPCTGNLDGDDAVGPADLAQLLGAWGSNPGHPADFTGDDIVNAADLAVLLGNWGPC